MRFRYNPNCSCQRCRAHGYMGPAVLITLGVLFLLDQMGHAHWMDFSYTWPALLIVIGVVMLLGHTASIAGHVPRPWRSGVEPSGPYPGQPVPPGAPGYPPQPPVVTPPPGAPAGFITPVQPGQPDDKGVRNG